MRDWCSECQYETYDGAEEPCINCETVYNENPSEFTPKNPVKPITNAPVIVPSSKEETE